MTRDERATPAELERLQTRIVPFEPVHEAGFRTLVSETLREFGFEPNPEMDPDLADPAGAYESLWVAVADGCSRQHSSTRVPTVSR